MRASARFFMSLHFLSAYLLAILWLTPAMLWPEHDSARWLQVLLLWLISICHGWYLYKGYAQKTFVIPLFSRKSDVIAVVILLASIISVGMAPDTMRAWSEWMLITGLLSVAATVGRFDEIARNRIVQMAAIAITAYSLGVTVIIVIGLSQGMPSQLDSSIQGFSNIRFWNHVQVVAVPIIVLAIFVDQRLWWRWSMVIGLSLCFALLWGTAGRAAALALLVSLALILWWFRPAPWRVGGLVFTSLAIGVLLGEYLVRWLPETLNISTSQLYLLRPTHLQSESARVMLWTHAWDLFLTSPWWGVGPQHFAHYPNFIAAHPHNVYLQLLAEWGVWIALAGLLMVIGGVARLASKARQDWRLNQSPVGMLLLWACLAVMVDGLFSGNFVMPISQVWIAVVFGLAWGYSRQTHSVGCLQDDRLSASPRKQFVFAWIWFLLITIFFVCTTIEFFQLKERMAMPIDWNHQHLWMAPRFWAVGWF